MVQGLPVLSPQMENPFLNGVRLMITVPVEAHERDFCLGIANTTFDVSRNNVVGICPDLIPRLDL